MRRAVFTWAAVIVAMLAVESRGDLPDWAVDKPDLPVSGAASKLQKKISVKYHETRIEDAVAEIAKATGANIVVNWRSLDGAGIEKGTTINDIALNDVPAMKVIEVVLEYIGGDLVPLAVDTCTDIDVATISTVESLGKRTHIRSYDIRPLLPRGGDHWAPRLNPRENPGPSLFEEVDESDLSRGEMIGMIQDQVRDTVDPDSWRSAGGLVSSMSEINGVLIINSTCEHHRKVAAMLRLIYSHRPKQVQIQTQAVGMTTAAVNALIAESARGRMVVDAKIAETVSTKLAEPGDDRTPLGGGRFILVDEQRGYTMDRSVRTRVPEPPNATIEQHVNVRPNQEGDPKAQPLDPEVKKDGVVLRRVAGSDRRIDVHVDAPRADASTKTFSLPLSGLVVEVEPTIGLGGETITLDVVVHHVGPTVSGDADEASGVPDRAERRLRSTVTIPNGGAAILSMPDAERGGEIVVFVRAQVVE